MKDDELRAQARAAMTLGELARIEAAGARSGFVIPEVRAVRHDLLTRLARGLERARRTIPVGVVLEVPPYAAPVLRQVYHAGEPMGDRLQRCSEDRPSWFALRDLGPALDAQGPFRRFLLVERPGFLSMIPGEYFEVTGLRRDAKVSRLEALVGMDFSRADQEWSASGFAFAPCPCGGIGDRIDLQGDVRCGPCGALEVGRRCPGCGRRELNEGFEICPEPGCGHRLPDPRLRFDRNASYGRFAFQVGDVSPETVEIQDVVLTPDPLPIDRAQELRRWFDQVMRPEPEDE